MFFSSVYSLKRTYLLYHVKYAASTGGNGSHKEICSVILFVEMRCIHVMERKKILRKTIILCQRNERANSNGDSASSIIRIFWRIVPYVYGDSLWQLNFKNVQAGNNDNDEDADADEEQGSDDEMMMKMKSTLELGVRRN